MDASLRLNKIEENLCCKLNSWSPQHIVPEQGRRPAPKQGGGRCGCRCGGDIVVAIVAFPEPSTLRTAPRMLRGLSGVALLLQEERTRKVLCAVCVPPM